MTLSDGKMGENYKIQRIELEENVKRRLEILGMTWNSSVLVLNKKRDGAMVIKVRGTRFAIARSFAQGIFVGGDGE